MKVQIEISRLLYALGLIYPPVFLANQFLVPTLTFQTLLPMLLNKQSSYVTAQAYYPSAFPISHQNAYTPTSCTPY